MEGTRAADDGATRDYYNRAARLPWRNYLGDWHDANNTVQGEAAFGTATIVDNDQPESIQWDITALVQGWVSGVYANKGLVVRRVAGSGAFDFHSREHAVESERPVLIVVTQQGTMTLEPEADSYLEPSTYQCMGDSDRLRISDSVPALLRFNLNSLPASAAITSAVLRMHVYQKYGGGSLVAGIFRCSQGHELPPSDPIPGLAVRYPNDKGIAADANVYLFEDFEDGDWGSDWTFGSGASTLEPVSSDSVRAFLPLQGKALRVCIPAGGNTGMNVGYDFANEAGSEPEEVYFRYYVRISNDWDTVDGGKFPGISGTYGVAGWGGRKSDGTDGWSARGTFRVRPPAGNPLGGTVPIGNYVYHADMAGTYGDIDLWQRDYRGYLERDRWYCIEQYLKMNTPGRKDGILRAWVDGRLAYERTDWRWRLVDRLKIERIWMNVYHGGTTPADSNEHLYIDNVVIARQYIGPRAGGEPTPAEARRAWIKK